MEASVATGNVPWRNIPLTGKNAMGRSIMVDLEDEKRMLGRKWYLSDNGIVVSLNGKNVHGNSTVIPASHFILDGAPRSTKIKYLDRDKLNLRKSNLKIMAFPLRDGHGKTLYHGINFQNSKSKKKYIVKVKKQYCGCTNDLEVAMFMADVCRVRKMKSWDAAMKGDLLNYPDRKDEIMEALRNGEDLRFLYGSKKRSAKSNYSYVNPSGRGFRGECEIGDMNFYTKTLRTDREAAFALYDLVVRKVGVRKASKYMPLELALGKAGASLRKQKPPIAPPVSPESEAKPEAPPVVPGEAQPPSPVDEQFRDAEKDLKQLIASLPPLSDDLRKAIENTAEAVARMLYESTETGKEFVDRGPGHYIFDSADRVRVLMEKIMGLGYYIGKMKPCVVVELLKKE